MNRVEIKIQAIREFIYAYEKKKYEIMTEGGTLLSPVCFMVDFCTELRIAGDIVF